ncbi:MAG: recombinase family protein [Lachnospiraceae bacterium]|nr:recombinase family protein [Lachnospiraceae bacterium]
MARKSRKPSASGTLDAAAQAKAEMKLYRTAVYARLSVEDSKNPDCDTIENQLSLVRNYVESKPYLRQTAEYIDNGVSGTRFDRPEFMRMVADMRAGEIDCIVVKDLSRLGRNYLEAGDYLEKIFPFFGVRFIAVTDGYDSINPNTAEDGLIVPLKNLINEAYAKDMSKKISTAIDIKQRQGKFIGSRAAYGYMKSPEDKNQLIVDREVSGIVVRIFECKARGMGNASIAKMLNEEGVASPMRYKYEKGLTKNKRYAESLWNDGTIAAMIVNPVYIGDMEQGIQKEAMYMGIRKHKPQKSGRIYVEGTHEPILSRELFDRVQELVEERKQKVIASRGKYENVEKKENKFDHILFCGDCGGRLKFYRRVDNRSGIAKVYYDYTCPNSESYGEQFCKKKKIKMQDLEEAVEAALRMHMNLFLDTKEVLQRLNRTAQAKQIKTDYRRQITDTRNRLERAQSMNSSLYNDYADGLLNERDYLFAKQKYVKEAENLGQKLSELAAMQTTYETEYAGGQDFAKIMGQYAGFEELTSEMVHALISRIVFFGEGRIEIEYAFDDELKAFVELAEGRKEEIACMQRAV